MPEPGNEMTSAMDSGRFTLLEENGGAAISCCIVPTPKPILPQWTCSVYCTTPWIRPATTRRNGMNGRDEWHGEAMSTIKGSRSDDSCARWGWTRPTPAAAHERGEFRAPGLSLSPSLASRSRRPTTCVAWTSPTGLYSTAEETAGATPHSDDGDPYKHRKISGVVELQSALQSTLEIEGHDIQLEPGDLCLFPSSIRHRATAPTEGVRFSLVMWFGDRMPDLQQ